ncbi:DNA adenine methylase [Bacteroides heparinolyticus]|uniref:DNA adenine methylase n=1 Tax=Prevotella heparinolytica TaxID=28113 RepID=UPI00359FCD80
MKNYTQAPLPFMGQKRRFIKEFKKVLAGYSDDIVVVDLFGGSGLLSHVAKKEKPKAKVIYNDYDGYHKRIADIPRTNALLSEIRAITEGLPKDKMVPNEKKEEILNVIRREEINGTIDYITLSASLLFSMKYATNFTELSKETFYNNVRKAPYDANGYLDGLTIVCKDYKELFFEYKDVDDVLFLIDPPYLSTEVGTYNMTWKLADYLDVLTILQGANYVYFTSNKSQIIELCEWLGENKIKSNPFKDSLQVKIDTTLNYTSKYTDIMIYRQQNEKEQVLQSFG